MATCSSSSADAHAEPDRRARDRGPRRGLGPAAASAEWMGEFRDDIGGWLPLEMLEGAVDRGVT
jgi:hypothetical protein